MGRQRVSCVLLLIFLLQCITVCEALFGKKKREEERAAQEAAKLEEERLAELFVLFGFEFDKALVFYVFTALVALALTFMMAEITDEERAVDVVVVGCGLPKKGMGWYHLTQLLEMTTVNVRSVVEPFFMNPKLCPSPPPSWEEFVQSLASRGIQVTDSVAALTSFNKKRQTMCLIAGRTPDNPKLFRECVAKGANVIYLEKPGAPSVKELEDMKKLAEKNNVKVYIGYNKNVTPYVAKAIALARKTPNSHVFFCHNNSYNQADLPEVFTRNSEGMLKNMAIHELALLVTFFGVTVDNIEKFQVNTNILFSEKLSLWRPDTPKPKSVYITDFSRVAFKITTKAGANVSVMADRCGGNVSFAVVKGADGMEVNKFEFPDAETAAQVEEKVKADPEMMPYFFVQSDDYLELKNRVVNGTLEGKDAEGVATIQVGIEALTLAEYGTKELNSALKTT